jgi:hypothetical protein
VPAEQIAENLAYINWTVLTGLAVGSFWAAALGRLRTEATTGYLGFVALSAAVLAALAALSDGALPALGVATAGAVPSTGPISPADPAWEPIRRDLLWTLAAVALVYGIAVLRGARGRWLAIAGSGIAAAVLLSGALSWGAGNAGHAAVLLVQLAILAAATGGAWAAMILGHWYLVTPKLPEAPLVRFARALLAIVAVQVGLFVVWQLVGAGPAGQPGFAALGGSWALFVWLRLIVGLAMPLVVTWGAVQTARTRSMESATGLLYIDVGLIAAGTILAAGLYFGAGLLV